MGVSGHIGHIGRVGGLAVALGIGAAVFAGGAAAWASPDSESSGPADSGPSTSEPPASSTPEPRPATQFERTPRSSADDEPASADEPDTSRVLDVITDGPDDPPAADAELPADSAAEDLADEKLQVPHSPPASMLPPAPLGESTPDAAAAASAVTTDSGPGPAAPESVSVELPPMPVDDGWSFAVSPDFMAGFAGDYVAAGGDPNDAARFFFGDLAVASLDALSASDIAPEQTRLLLGNLAASGYFGGIWLRDNLRDTDTATGAAPSGILGLATPDSGPSAVALHLFDVLATGLTLVADNTGDVMVRGVAHASVPLLLALYGYNRGYLEVVLENPPDEVPSMQDTLTCDGFLGCTSTAFPLSLATRYDDALDKLAAPTSAGWLEMALWTAVLESATGTGRFVWELGLAQSGAFSPVSYRALVELSSAYLMVSKAAALSSMIAYADSDTAVGRSSLRLQAGLWMWSGSYFGGLASDLAAGTLPAIVTT